MARTLADRFYSEREITPPSAEALFNACAKPGLATAARRWMRRGKLPGRPEERLRFFYRGHADASWGLSSSLYRTMRSSAGVAEKQMEHVEAAILEAMREEGLGHRMTDGELLAVLQHHGIPTRLVDVSKSALPALYFAASEADSRDGRLFMIGLRLGDDRSYPQIELAGTPALPWAGASIGRSYSSRAWTETVACAEDVGLDPRMRAQAGCFLVGGLIKRYAGENISVGGRLQPAEKWPDLTTLRIFFPLPGTKKPTAARWAAVGWNIRVPAEWKAELRRLLAQRDLTADYMYPDYDGCRRLGRRIAARGDVLTRVATPAR